MQIEHATDAGRGALANQQRNIGSGAGPQAQDQVRVFLWDESLATSPDAASASWLVFEQSFGAVVRAEASSRPASVLKAGNVRFLRDLPPSGEQFRTRLDDDLHRAFEAEPVEDGVIHAAEDVIGAAVRSIHGHEALECLRFYALDAENPAFAASVLQCLGRVLGVGTAPWRASLIRDALRAKSLQMRDAAAQAVETWGDQEAVEVLASHVDPDDWLRDYVTDVVFDLRAQG